MRSSLLALVLLAIAGADLARADDRVLVRVALLQMAADGNNQAANKTKAMACCRKAAALGADVALMPEMWNIGYTRFDPDKPNARPEFYAQAKATDSDYIQDFARLARELDMAIAVAYLQAYKPLPRNAVTLFDRHGKEVYTYAKVHTSDFKSMEASMTPGTDFYVGVLDTKAGPVKVGSMICFDREQPESARILMLKGAEIILTPNACRLDDFRIDQFKVRAGENILCTAMANYAGEGFEGRSVAFTSEAKLAVEAGAEEGIYIAVLDISKVRERRGRSIWGAAYRKPHRYQILVSPEKDPIWKRIDGNRRLWKAEER